MADEASNDIYRKIVLLMMNYKRQMARVAEKYEMTVAQGMMLMLFEPDKAIPMQQLSCRMGCDASNVTGLVERLDSLGIIKKTADPQDRRVKLIGLSAKGLTRRNALLKELKAAEAADLHKLSAKEQAVLAGLIDKITAKA